jgi:hypothetical protein
MILILSLYGFNYKGLPPDSFMLLQIMHFIREAKGSHLRLSCFNGKTVYRQKPVMQITGETKGMEEQVRQFRLERF